MIKSFRNEAARAAWERRFVKGVPHDVLRIGNRKLLQLHNARSLQDLRAPPGNRLEALSGDRRGQHSIRISDQGGSVSSGMAMAPAASRSWTIMPEQVGSR